MNIAWRVMRRDRPQMLSRMNLRITAIGLAMRVPQNAIERPQFPSIT